MTVHVALIGIDGLRLDDALPIAPVLSEFITSGAIADMTMEVPTISGPGWSSILTGASHAEHGVFDNTFHGHRLLDHPDFLSRAWFHDQSVTTWAAGSWPPLVDPTGPAPVIWWRDEAQRAERHRVFVRDGETFGYDRMDAEVVAWSRMALAGSGPRASFIYLGQVDLAGHVYGGISDEYRAAVSTTDARLGELIAAIHARISGSAEYGIAPHPDEEWLVAVTPTTGTSIRAVTAVANRSSYARSSPRSGYARMARAYARPRPISPQRWRPRMSPHCCYRLCAAESEARTATGAGFSAERVLRAQGLRRPR